MMVCAHGNVTEFCAERDMVICDTWDGDIRSYRGPCRVLVTDSDISEQEYYFCKGELLSKGIELISTRYRDDALLSEYLVYANDRRKKRSGGRQAFSDKAVIARIVALRAEGKTLREIREDEGVRHSDGRKLSVSTILNIIRSNT
jgi:hypothetical protein